jgi:hypothetical protein
LSQALVADTCNPSSSGGRDREDQGSKPAQTNSSQHPILKTLHNKRAGGVVQSVGPEFKPQYHKKKKILLKPEKLKLNIKSFDDFYVF